MDKNEAVKIVREFISKQFPKECNCCGKRYQSLKEYLLHTTHIGKPISYDAEGDNWQPTEPLGTFSLGNCACGTTLAIDSSGMDLRILWKLMTWAKSEAKEKKVNLSDILEDLRAAIDESVLQGYDNNSDNRS